MDFGDIYSIVLVAYGIMESILVIFAAIGIFAWRVWPIPLAWILNKVTRKQYGVIEVEKKGKKIIGYLADFSRDYYEKGNRLYNLAAAKDQDLVFTKYGVPVVHFDEGDAQPKAFHPHRENEGERARNSTSLSNLIANLTTWYKRMAFSLQDKNLRWVLIGIGVVALMTIVNGLLGLMTLSAIDGNTKAVHEMVMVLNSTR